MKKDFETWMRQDDRKKQSTAYQYARALDRISAHYSQKTNRYTDLAKLRDPEEAQKICDDYALGGRFSSFGSTGNGTVRNAIATYVRYLRDQRARAMLGRNQEEGFDPGHADDETTSSEQLSDQTTLEDADLQQQQQIKIGNFVKEYVRKVLDYCETEDHAELDRLMDSAYSKNTFDVNYPFCQETSQISALDSKRYWTPVHVVRGKSVRVTSQWYDSQVSKSRRLFTQYLLKRGLATKEELQELPPTVTAAVSRAASFARSPRSNARYRGNAIGNAQNLLVRNILSNLGEESFNDKDWLNTKAYFDDRCAYCGASGDLVIEHAVPINRQALGEHRLGNLVPSCRSCNVKKADTDFRDFLQEHPDRIEKIEQYMDEKNYVPLGDNEQVRMILDMAYQEVSFVADRYIRVLNSLFGESAEQDFDESDA